MNKANVIVLAGQSNAVGVAYTKYLQDHFDEATVKEIYDGYSNVKMRYFSHGIKNDCFEKTTINCTEAKKDTFGPEIGIAKKFKKVCPDESFFIIKCAFGGTTLIGDWCPPSAGEPYSPEASAAEREDIVNAIDTGDKPHPGWCYNEFVSLMKKSIDELKEKGYQPNICAFIWVQGEADAFEKVDVDEYGRLFDLLLKDFKSTFGEYIDDCAVIIVGISDSWDNYENFNRVKAEYAKANNYYYIGAEKLDYSKEPHEEPDLFHYDSDTVVKFGEEMAEIIIQHQIKEQNKGNQ